MVGGLEVDAMKSWNEYIKLCPYKSVEEKLCWLSKTAFEPSSDNHIIREFLEQVNLIVCDKNMEIQRLQKKLRDYESDKKKEG
jgi:hypothetical protein